MLNRYDKARPLYDLEGWIVFYGQQAKHVENDPEKWKRLLDLNQDSLAKIEAQRPSSSGITPLGGTERI